jgi:hypothetical protein
MLPHPGHKILVVDTSTVSLPEKPGFHFPKNSTKDVPVSVSEQTTPVYEGSDTEYQATCGGVG